MAKVWHFRDEVVAQIKLLEIRQLQVHVLDVIIACDDMLETWYDVENVDVVEVVARDVDLLQADRLMHKSLQII